VQFLRPEATKQFEGFKPKIYKDSKGKNTIGYGFNIDDSTVREFIPEDVLDGKRSITRKESDFIFKELYSVAQQDAIKFVGEASYANLNDARRGVLVDMAYNMGSPKLNQFIKLKQAVVHGNWRKAAHEMRNSKWFKQVNRRARILVEQMRTGKYK